MVPMQTEQPPVSHSNSAPPDAANALPAASPTYSSAIARVEIVEGTLVSLGVSDIGVTLAAGDAVGEGDVLVAATDARALIVFQDGATVAIDGPARAEFHADFGPDGMHGQIVVYSGSLVIDAVGGGLGGAHCSFAVETAAATLHIDDATVALSYARPVGLEAVLLGEGASADGGATIVNESGEFFLRHMHAAVSVESWLGAPRLAGSPGLGAPFDPAPPSDGSATGMTMDAPASAREDASASDIMFETGAGPASSGDMSFIFPEPPQQDLADHSAAHLDTLTPPSYQTPYQTPATVPHGATGFTDNGRAPDALFLYPPPAAPEPPTAATAPEPEPQRLRGWEPSGHAWDFEGVAAISSGARELPANPDRAFALLEPLEGATMALLEPRHASRAELEHFLGLPDATLNTLVDGTLVANGSAIRAHYTLHAGQTLRFDVLFDAIDSLPANDYAAFTVAGPNHGEAFVISTITATGSLGVTPWQTMHYTAGASGPVSIGFVVVNDTTIDGLSRLYIDGATSGGGGDAYELAAARDDAFGGRFELFTPKPTIDAGGQVLASFETGFDLNGRIGRVMDAGAFHEPDGAHGDYVPTDGDAMAVLHAYGASRPTLETFLGLHPEPGNVSALPDDLDGSASNAGSAVRLSLMAAAGDRVSFDWMFDAGDRLPDNDYAAFSVADAGGSRIFQLSDIRQTGAEGASGWQTSVYTVADDGELTLGFAVINDRQAGFYADDENSRLLIDNVRLNRDFGDGYQLVDLPAPGALETLADV